jgi:hypothetical protein
MSKANKGFFDYSSDETSNFVITNAGKKTDSKDMENESKKERHLVLYTSTTDRNRKIAFS